MYFAVNQDVQRIEAYYSFLSDVLVSQNDYYKRMFSEIVQQTQSLLVTHNYYDVLSERYEIVNFLSNFPEVINKIDPNDLKNSDFEQLISCFSAQLTEEN